MVEREKTQNTNMLELKKQTNKNRILKKRKNIKVFKRFTKYKSQFSADWQQFLN